MNSGQSLFSQLIDHLPRHEFRRCVERYAGNYRVRSFSCWDQFLTMIFAQLSYRESLRDIVACLRSQQSRLYHLGIRAKVSRSTLADANESRDWRIYGDFAQALIAEARIKAFYGTSENAVKTQIWIAVCGYLLVAIVRKRLKLPLNLYTILQILSVSLFEKMPINQALSFNDPLSNTGSLPKQLQLHGF